MKYIFHIINHNITVNMTFYHRSIIFSGNLHILNLFQLSSSSFHKFYYFEDEANRLIDLKVPKDKHRIIKKNNLREKFPSSPDYKQILRVSQGQNLGIDWRRAKKTKVSWEDQVKESMQSGNLKSMIFP